MSASVVVMAHQTYRLAGPYWTAVYLRALEVPLWISRRMIEEFALIKT